MNGSVIRETVLQCWSVQFYESLGALARDDVLTSIDSSGPRSPP